MDRAGSTIATSGIVTNSDGTKFSYRVQIYKLVGRTSWTQMGEDINSEALGSIHLDDARADVSLSGDGLQVAVASINTSNRGDNNNTTLTQGTIRVYRFESESWDLVASNWKDSNGDTPLDLTDTAKGGQFLGLQVSLDHTASKIIIGMRYEDSTGKVVVCNIIDNETNESICTTIHSEETMQEGDHAGSSVMIATALSPPCNVPSDDGSTCDSANLTCAIFGSTGYDSSGDGGGHNAGAASVYCEEADGSWASRGGPLIGEAAGDEFGISVAISADSNYIAVGSSFNDPEPSKKDAGHVRVFKYDHVE